MLREEIAALQRRLDRPSEDAIEWRVAYEETKETLEKVTDEEQGDASELKEKNCQLEETMDRLCTEKLDLEGKVVELTQSSNETRLEIESIMKEVDKLEREMVSCQEELQLRRDECQDYKTRAKDAEFKLQDLLTNAEIANEKKVSLEDQNEQLQTSVKDFLQKISELTEALEKKSADLLELESLVNGNEEELKHAIQTLTDELNESNNDVAKNNLLVTDLETRLSNASEEKQSLGAQIKDALSEIEDQKDAIAGMEQKFGELAQEKEDALELNKKESNLIEAEMIEKLESQQHNLVLLAGEKEKLEFRLSSVKEQMELSTGNVDEKQVMLQDLEAQLSKSSAEHEAIERELKAGMNILEKDLCKTRERINVLSTKIAEVQAERETAINLLEEDKMLMAQNLSNEIEGLKNASVQSSDEKQDLQLKIKSHECQELKLQSTIESLTDLVSKLEVDLAELQKEQNNAKDLEVTQTQLKICDLTKERDELMEEIVIMDEEINTVAKENLNLSACVRDTETQVALLKAELGETSEDWQNTLGKVQAEKEVIQTALDHKMTRQSQLESIIEKQEIDIEELSTKLTAQQKSVDDTQSKLEKALEAQKVLTLTRDETNDAHVSAIESVNEMKAALEVDIVTYQEKIAVLTNEKTRWEEELVEIRENTMKVKDDGRIACIQLSEGESKLHTLEVQYKDQLNEKDSELGCLEVKLKSVESDCSSLRKQNKAIASSEVDMQEKYNLVKDQFTLLKREKGNLEFELDTMQADQDALGDQVRVHKDENENLKTQNERLKTLLEDMKNNDNSSSSGSTWNSGSMLSYDTLHTNMDSMVDKTAIEQSAPVALPAPVEHPEPVQEENEDETGDLDDSFDEDMFLPNNEDKIASAKLPAENEEQSPARTSMNADQNEVSIFEDENKENSVTKPAVSFCSTPRKGKDDYGKRRVPLSDRKNRTPGTAQSKRLLSSTNKMMSSKKSRTANYMFIDNKKLFN